MPKVRHSILKLSLTPSRANLLALYRPLKGSPMIPASELCALHGNEGDDFDLTTILTRGLKIRSRVVSAPDHKQVAGCLIANRIRLLCAGWGKIFRSTKS